MNILKSPRTARGLLKRLLLFNRTTNQKPIILEVGFSYDKINDAIKLTSKDTRIYDLVIRFKLSDLKETGETFLEIIIDRSKIRKPKYIPGTDYIDSLIEKAIFLYNRRPLRPVIIGIS